MRISVAFDTSKLRRDIEEEKARIGRQMRRAINEAAYQARDDVREAMRTTFDRPTPYVLNGIAVAPAADREGLTAAEAIVDWRPPGARGNPTSKILRAEIEGGRRRLKGFEKALGLPPALAAVPGPAANIDAYGNIPDAQISRILSQLRAGRSGRGGEQYFLVRPLDGGLPPGVYRYSAGVRPVLVIAFVRSAGYRARFAPAEIVRASVARNMPRIWQQAQAGTLPFRRPDR